MDQETRNELAATRKGLLHLNGLALVVRTPNDADAAFAAGEWRRQAKLKTKSPLAALAEEWDSLPPAMRSALADKAITYKSGGESEPTTEQVTAQIWTPEGCRVWVWCLARDDQPDLKIEQLTPLVTEENVVQVLADLARATKVEKAFPNSPGRTSSPAG
jgi:hypothetical protein